MEKEFRYDTQKVIARNDSGKIKSIKPIYSIDDDVFTRFHKQANIVRSMAKLFPETKTMVEIHAIPEAIYKMLKEDVDHTPGFQDGAGKFFFSPTPNSVIIAFKEI